MRRFLGIAIGLGWRSSLAAGLLAAFSACELKAPYEFEETDVKGEAREGKRLFFAYGCVACHESPEFSGYEGRIGPPLGNWRNRKYIAGNLPNQPDELIRWLMNPEAVEPGTAMPNLGVTQSEARDLAAYLYSQ